MDVIVARSKSYIVPETQKLNAPGLGNDMNNVVNDQARRVLQGVVKTVDANPELVAKAIGSKPESNGNGEGNISMKTDRGAIVELLTRAN